MNEDLQLFLESFWPIVWGGITGTIPLALISFAIGLVLALGVALMRLSKNRVVSGIGRFYVSVIRGTPLLVQLFVIFYGLPAIGVVIGSFAAYALARLKMRGKFLLLAIVLSISTFPQIAIAAPLFRLWSEIGFYNTLYGLIIPYLTFALPLAVWLLVGYFRQLPPELEDAAFVDGASRLRTLTTIVLPLAAPGIATTAILTFVYCWNEFLFALSFTITHERQTVPVAVALFRGQFQIPWGQILAATIVSTLPVLVLVAGFQRRILSGLTAGSVK